MADVKISGLPASTTPLAGTEVLPIVQSSTTKKVAVSDLTAGRSVSATSFVPSGATIPTIGMYSPVANSVGISTNSINAVYIDSGQNVGINTASRGAKLDIKGGAASPPALGSGNGLFSIAPSGFGMWMGVDGSGNSWWQATRTDSAIAYPILINPNGGGVAIGSSTAPGSNNLTVAGTGKFGTTASVGAATPSTSGAGITFPATQSASTDVNTLDDYEEGTFTPTVIGTTSAGTATYTSQSGTYTKVGRQVTVNIYVLYTSGTGTGKLKLAGLPFTSSATNLASCSVGVFSNITMTASNFPTPFINVSTTEVTFWSAPVGGGGYVIIDYDAAGEIMVSATYFV
jgi:hypothetical protein